ncbi:MAG: GrpB family protein [Actinomycetota bacterium]
MPFADEVRPVDIVPYRTTWASEFDALGGRLWTALNPVALAIDHIGSTAVPRLPAKDVIDVQVLVANLDRVMLVKRFERIGFRQRREPWNVVETSFGARCEKLVFAPPVGERACNVHVRVEDQPNARFALLFRDFLRADTAVRDAWGEFKSRLAAEVPDLAHYGQIKAPATEILMQAASTWAAGDSTSELLPRSASPESVGGA